MRYINKTDLLIIAKNSSILMMGVGVLCLVPIIVDLLFLEFNAIYYLVPASISIFIGFIFYRFLDKYIIKEMRIKHAMIVSALSWLWACIICGSILWGVTGISFIDAAFESMSALTGSGITIYSNVEVLPYSILFFRAFQQWIGGLGIIFIIIFFLTKPGSISSFLYQSEAREDQLEPSINTTIKQSLKIYLIYTALGIILYSLAGMSIFDSVCNTFTTISTGGMSVKNANIGFYQNDWIYFITMIVSFYIMLLFFLVGIYVML